MKPSFYDESDLYRAEIAAVQRKKGRQKYTEEFDPDSWSDDELADHAMSEFHDGQEYVAGLRKRMRQLRALIETYEEFIPELLETIADLEEQLRNGAVNNEGRSNTIIQDGV